MTIPRHGTDRTKSQARQMRREPTPPEQELWRFLSQSQLGVRFRRQVVKLGYILDFWCASEKLAVEIDGSTHVHVPHPTSSDFRLRGTERDLRLEKWGIVVLHFPAVRDPESITAEIQDWLRQRHQDPETVPSRFRNYPLAVQISFAFSDVQHYTAPSHILEAMTAEQRGLYARKRCAAIHRLLGDLQAQRQELERIAP